MTTEEMLLSKYGATLDTRNLAEVLHMSLKGVQNAIAMETFDIPTFKLRKKRLAHVRDVAGYIDDGRKSAA
ncbi:MAG: hypothetical protein Q2484_17030 [Candidatus Sedimenticola sp. (ex Thyasira tokunagai)]